jgi:hypothetical protein
MQNKDQLVRMARVMRSNDPAAQLEQTIIRTAFLPKFEGDGWELTKPMEAIARGETDADKIREGIDPNSQHVVTLLLTAVNEATEDDQSDNSQDFFDRHKVEFRRCMQLATEERAAAAFPKFRADENLTMEQERQHVRDTLISRWESSGWKLSAPIEAIWRGERNLETLTAGLDRADTNIVRLILDADSDKPKFKALKPQDVTQGSPVESAKVGRLREGDVVTAVTGQRESMTVVNRLAGTRTQVNRIQIGENRYVTESSSSDGKFLEQIATDGEGGGAGQGLAALLAALSEAVDEAIEEAEADSKDPDVLQKVGEKLMAEGDYDTAVAK